jgi:hypothetical protein
MAPRTRGKIVTVLVAVPLSLLVTEGLLRLFTDIDPRFYDQAGSQRLVTPEDDNPVDNPFDFPVGMRATRPGSTSRLAGSPVHINSHGMRSDREFAFEKPEDVTRVMLVGDSVTFSNTRFEDSIGEALRRRLGEELGQDHVEVPAFATPAWGFNNYIVAIEKAVSRFEIDHLVVNFIMNDVPDKPLLLDLEASWGDPRRAMATYPLIRTIAKDSVLGTLIIWRLKRPAARLGAMDPNLLRIAEPMEKLSDLFEYLRPAFERLRRFCDEQDVACTVAVWPYAVQIDEAIGRKVVEEWYGRSFDPALLELRPQRLVLELCREKGLDCIDLAEVFREELQKRDLYFETPEGRMDYMHYNAAGNDLGASVLAEHILASDSFLSRAAPERPN